MINTAMSAKVILPYEGENFSLKENFQIDAFLNEISKLKLGWTKLTKREIDCAFFLVQGKSNKEIAVKLNTSPRAVEDYVISIRYKMNCKSKSELISLLCKWPFVSIQTICTCFINRISGIFVN